MCLATTTLGANSEQPDAPATSLHLPLWGHEQHVLASHVAVRWRRKAWGCGMCMGTDSQHSVGDVVVQGLVEECVRDQTLKRYRKHQCHPAHGDHVMCLLGTAPMLLVRLPLLHGVVVAQAHGRDIMLCVALSL